MIIYYYHYLLLWLLIILLLLLFVIWHCVTWRATSKASSKSIIYDIQVLHYTEQHEIICVLIKNRIICIVYNRLKSTFVKFHEIEISTKGEVLYCSDFGGLRPTKDATAHRVLACAGETGFLYLLDFTGEFGGYKAF